MDLSGCYEAGLLEAIDEQVQAACTAPVLNELMALGNGGSRAVRHTIAAMLMEGSMMQPELEPHLIRMHDAEMLVPAPSATTPISTPVSTTRRTSASMFRPENPLLPNYKWVPIGYHGRASSIIVSGTRFSAAGRPDASRPECGSAVRPIAAARLRAGAGRASSAPATRCGERIPVDRAEEHLFGLCLVNDWSARDIQTWEYQPLGPFLAKSFATSVSPWIVTLDALAPFRAPPYARPDGDPQPLPYLAAGDRGGLDITLEVWLRTAQMNEPVLLSRGNSGDLYWTLAQLVTHHSSNGCNLAARRFARQRNDLRSHEGFARVDARAVVGREGAGGPSERRGALFPRRR